MSIFLSKNRFFVGPRKIGSPLLPKAAVFCFSALFTRCQAVLDHINICAFCNKQNSSLKKHGCYFAQRRPRLCYQTKKNPKPSPPGARFGFLLFCA